MQAKQAIIQAARRLFYTRGFEKTSFSELAEAAGVPKGNFYYHFKSKDDVLKAVLEARHGDISDALAKWSENIDTPELRLSRFVEMLTKDQEDLAHYGCPTGSLLTELGKKRGDLKPMVVAIMDQYLGFVAKQWKQLGYSPAKAQSLATRLLAHCQGAVLLAHAYEDPKLLVREVKSIKLWIKESLPKN